MNAAHVESSLDKIRVIFEALSNRIESMKSGEKIPATQLSKELGEQFGTTGPTLYPLLKYVLDGYPGVTITRGSKGGITKL